MRFLVIFLLKCFKDVSAVIENKLIMSKSACGCAVPLSRTNSESLLSRR